MIVRFDTPELAVKRFLKIIEERKQDKACLGTNDYGSLFVERFEEFQIIYKLNGTEINVYVETTLLTGHAIYQLINVIKMQSLMMEV